MVVAGGDVAGFVVALLAPAQEKPGAPSGSDNPECLQILARVPRGTKLPLLGNRRRDRRLGTVPGICVTGHGLVL